MILFAYGPNLASVSTVVLQSVRGVFIRFYLKEDFLHLNKSTDHLEAESYLLELQFT